MTTDNVLSENRSCGFYKRAGRAYAIITTPEGITSWEVSEAVYKAFQSWLRKWGTPTITRGRYLTDERTQEKIKRMLLDHIAFPF